MKFQAEIVDTTIMLTRNPKVRQFQVIGSTLIDGVDAQDVDFLVLVEGETFLTDTRWAFGSDWDFRSGKYDDQTDKWGTLWKGNVNLIVTVDPTWYELAKLSNEVAVALQLKDKGDRIVTYRVIRDRYTAAEANKRRDGQS